jgi:hypothetical protein
MNEVKHWYLVSGIWYRMSSQSSEMSIKLRIMGGFVTRVPFVPFVPSYNTQLSSPTIHHLFTITNTHRQKKKKKKGQPSEHHLYIAATRNQPTSTQY